VSRELKALSREKEAVSSEQKVGWGVQETDNSKQVAVRSSKPHRNLIAWQEAMGLTVEIYEATRKFPKEEVYALTSQLRRAAISVPSNIAEGAAGRTTRQFSNFLSNAIGSLNEIDTQMELSLRLGYLPQNDYDRLFGLLDECLALTYGLRKSLKKK
jgi:four helix bundle protein